MTDHCYLHPRRLITNVLAQHQISDLTNFLAPEHSTSEPNFDSLGTPLTLSRTFSSIPGPRVRGRPFLCCHSSAVISVSEIHAIPLSSCSYYLPISSSDCIGSLYLKLLHFLSAPRTLMRLRVSEFLNFRRAYTTSS